ncbi:MAG: MBL fold metallo-hydrolase [Lachnospiraceae bacterium]
MQFAGIRGKVIATPGHTPVAAAVIILKKIKILISGDTLFQESVGRTDLPDRQHECTGQICEVRSLSYPAADETRVYPGHGMMTTIGYEKENNAFI